MISQRPMFKTWSHTKFLYEVLTTTRYNDDTLLTYGVHKQPREFTGHGER